MSPSGYPVKNGIAIASEIARMVFALTAPVPKNPVPAFVGMISGAALKDFSPTSMETSETTAVTVRELAENACHFGHKVSRWNPKMAPYLWGKKGGVHIFDLEKTTIAFARLLDTISRLSDEGRVILFVSTKPQTKAILKEINETKGQPTVSEKWVGGLLTNFDTIKSRIRRLKDIRDMTTTGDIEKFPKKEQAQIKKEAEKLETLFSGIIDMYRMPDALFVVDGVRDCIAIREANRLGIPVYGIADSNADPDGYTDFVPANDDAITAVSFLLGKVFHVLKSPKARKS